MSFGVREKIAVSWFSNAYAFLGKFLRCREIFLSHFQSLFVFEIGDRANFNSVSKVISELLWLCI